MLNQRADEIEADVARGMPGEVALASLTSVAAEVLGLSDRQVLGAVDRYPHTDIVTE